jgi:hypothetical protein
MKTRDVILAVACFVFGLLNFWRFYLNHHDFNLLSGIFVTAAGVFLVCVLRQERRWSKGR